MTKYIQAAMERATYEILPDDGSYYGRIPSFPGVWANAATLEGCRKELAEVLEDWLLIGLSQQLPIPIIDGIDLTVRDVA